MRATALAIILVVISAGTYGDVRMDLKAFLDSVIRYNKRTNYESRRTFREFDPERGSTHKLPSAYREQCIRPMVSVIRVAFVRHCVLLASQPSPLAGTKTPSLANVLSQRLAI